MHRYKRFPILDGSSAIEGELAGLIKIIPALKAKNMIQGIFPFPIPQNVLKYSEIILVFRFLVRESLSVLFHNF
jgi:hypothetical protein